VTAKNKQQNADKKRESENYTTMLRDINDDTCDRWKENSCQHNKRRRDVGNNVAHFTVTFLFRANYVILVIITIINIGCCTTLTANYHFIQFTIKEL